MPEPLIRIENLTINFHQGNESSFAVSDFSMDIPPATTVALVGESGSGKSVTAHAILGLLPKTQTQVSGTIEFMGENLLTASPRRLQQIRGNQISMIFQEPMSSLNPLHTIEKQISEVLILHRGMSNEEARLRCLELLDQVQIPNPHQRLKSLPHELSGGQRQRVMIAMALANEPKLLIADEPTTALDVTVQKQILELLHRLQVELQMTMLLISHDLHMVHRHAQHVAVMKQGKLIEQGEVSQIFNHPSADYTRQLIDAEPSGQPAAIAKDSPILLQTSKLKVWFPIKQGLFRRTVSHIKAVNGINISVRQGETLGIVGESGSGKTTLALALLRLIESEGTINFTGTEIDKLNQRQCRTLRSRLQIVFQDPFGSLSPRMSIADIVAEGLDIHSKLPPPEREKRIIQALTDVGIDPDSRHRYPHEFSGGQRQRIAIARALILNPQIIILDEPTSALDRTIQGQIISLLRDLQQRYQLTFIFISHDLAVIRAMSHRIMVMRDGVVLEQGDCETLFVSPKEPYTRDLIEAAQA